MWVRRGAMMACTLAVLSAPAVFAQTVGVATLSGTVTDESGSGVPGVDVTVNQTDTGSTRFVTTDSRGGYSFTNLPIGPYKLTAKLSGCTTFEQSGITLRVGDTRSINVLLKIGGMAET